MLLLIVAAVICGVRYNRRQNMTLRSDVCLWLTKVNLAVLVLAIVSIIIEWSTDFQLRWNIGRNSMLLAELTGIVAFFVGIRTEKTRSVKLYLRIFLAFAILFLPIIFFAMFFTRHITLQADITRCVLKKDCLAQAILISR